MEQWPGSKLRKKYIKAIYCHHALFNLDTEYIKLNAGMGEAQAEVKITRVNIDNDGYADDSTLMAEIKGELKSLLMKVKEEIEKAGLKFNIQKMKIIAPSPITSCKKMGKQWK